MHDRDVSARENTSSMSANIELRGVRVHNLKSIDVDVPLNHLTVITGVSGSGKSSLAFDTLYAEGQRRYIESFSSAARRHLDRLEKPDADRIAHIPPAVALRQNAAARSASRRSTIATVTEIDDLLRILFSRIGTVVCPDCHIAVEQDSSATIAEWIGSLPDSRKVQIGFSLQRSQLGDASTRSGVQDVSVSTAVSTLLESGFTRAVILETAAATRSTVDDSQAPATGCTVAIQDLDSPKATSISDGCELAIVIVDRIVAGKTSGERIIEAAETSMRESNGRCVVLAQCPIGDANSANFRSSLLSRIGGDDWHVLRFSSNFDCSLCGRAFVKPEPSTLSFRSPLGACLTCRGTGTVTTLDLEDLIPDRSLSLRAGAVAAFADDRWKRERERLLRFAESVGISIDVAFQDLQEEQRQQIFSGEMSGKNSSARTSDGLSGLFERLESRKQQTAVREFLRQWRKIDQCKTCRGTRLSPDALVVRIGNLTTSDGKSQPASMGDVSALTVDELSHFLQETSTNIPTEWSAVGANIMSDIAERLSFLKSAGLGYLPLNREIASLSRGEAQRVAMTSIAGANLVNTLFVIDEPSAGLHPRDVVRVLSIVKSLRDRSNTVVVVEHETEFLTAADFVVDIGPAAGQQGGQLIYAGQPDGLADIETSATGRWLKKESTKSDSEAEFESVNRPNRRPASGWLRLRGATCNSVRDCSVDVLLGGLCVVTGVSGAGKSSLIENVLFPAVCQELGQTCSIDHAGKYETLLGIDQVRSVELIDDLPLAGSRRSNPATWLKVFDEIRRLFAETEDARNRNLTTSHFSFNTDSGGRCSKCEGTGRVEIDMQFLADVSMTCPDCNGSRYLPHILEVQWRARTIADVLAMTAAEAFSFFRGQSRIQKRLRSLKDVGLDYLTLGQPLATLSGGESQRLKLAASLATSSRTGSLLIMNEPTTGLHPLDVSRLLECFEGLISVGHSLVVIEHNLDVIRHADHIIDMGPEAGPGGGRIVATGSVADIAACPESITGRYLRKPASHD
jgi:excinuclease ABC subunit A